MGGRTLLSALDADQYGFPRAGYPAHSIGEPAIATDWTVASDAELVDQTRQGAEAASRELVRRYGRSVVNFLARLVGDPALAEDLAQETFVKVFLKLDAFDVDRRFSSWIFTVARNTAIDYRRRRRLETVPIVEDDPIKARSASRQAERTAISTETPADTVERTHLAEALDGALADLRPEYREAVLLHYLEGLTYDEIAEVFGVPAGTVKTHIHRARKELAVALARRGWGPSP
jgi:RNA polymerase sigma-70 factor (ECF subfamily)